MKIFSSKHLKYELLWYENVFEICVIYKLIGSQKQKNCDQIFCIQFFNLYHHSIKLNYIEKNHSFMHEKLGLKLKRVKIKNQPKSRKEKENFKIYRLFSKL